MTVTMTTTNSRIEDKKPPRLIQPPMGILEIVPYVKNAHRTMHCQVSNLQQVPVERKDIMQINAQKQATGPQGNMLRDEFAFVRIRISTLETTLEDIQVHHQNLLKHTS
ncbi:hypothetical protein Tco_1448887 [Tanacetum coccineum]